jgi:hypothetical protein
MNLFLKMNQKMPIPRSPGSKLFRLGTETVLFLTKRKELLFQKYETYVSSEELETCPERTLVGKSEMPASIESLQRYSNDRSIDILVDIPTRVEDTSPIPQVTQFEELSATSPEPRLVAVPREITKTNDQDRSIAKRLIRKWSLERGFGEMNETSESIQKRRWRPRPFNFQRRSRRREPNPRSQDTQVVVQLKSQNGVAFIKDVADLSKQIAFEFETSVRPEFAVVNLPLIKAATIVQEQTVYQSSGLPSDY